MNSSSIKPPKAGPTSIVVIAGAIAFAALVCISLTGRRRLVYDEVYYVEQTVTILRERGLNTAFLKEFPYPAGLANCVMLRLLEPIVGIQPPQVRVYNLFFLAAVIGLCGGAALCGW